MRRVAVILGLSALVACGGGGGGSPTASGGSAAAPAATPTPAPSGWPAGTTVQLVNGETGQAIAGPLILAGATVQSGAPLASSAAEGATVDVTIAGFLPRQTLVRTGETRLVLWPDSGSLPGDYTRALVYASAGGSGSLDVMRRMATRVRTVAVVPSAAIQADPEAMAAHRDAIEALNNASAPLGVTYTLGGTGDFSVPVTIDPAASSCASSSTRAVTNRWASSANELVRAEVTYCRDAIARTPGTIAHELGHTFGLQHSTEPFDMMYPYAQSSRATTPTSKESLTMSLMRARRSGTEWPDNDRAATAAAAVRFESIVD